ncbi:MAG: patatin-like phospholipase family protein [Actinomycetota bacterium]|nr:patatin-like phospholipase family protein [Actinomycetota bacterium]
MNELEGTAPEPDLVEPVRFIPGDEEKEPEAGMGLCLSGGGYRAMLFHAGALWRLRETGLLAELKRISSVSGGSIASGVLAMAWEQLASEDGMDLFVSEVVDPIRDLASRTIDESAIALGILTRDTIGERVSGSLAKHLFQDRTLQDLPDEPRFVFNATNLASGVLWRFSKPYMADYRVGTIRNPTTALADAVAASAAFPPVLSPFVLDLESADWETVEGNNLTTEEYRSEVVLSDGGVYDNLGLETVWKRLETVLISDGGGRLAVDPDPPADWPRQSIRIMKVLDSQVRQLRKRQLMDSFDSGSRKGAYWGIWSDIAEHGAPGALPCPADATRALAEEPTRLRALPDERQERLINWGYAVCDSAIRTRIDPALEPTPSWPYPASGVG